MEPAPEHPTDTALASTTFCVLDLETTGGSRDVDRITEVGAVLVRGGEVLGTFQSLVFVGAPIPPEITAITGITNAMLRTAPTIEDVLPRLVEFMRGAVLVCHNVGFDAGFLTNAFDRADYPPLTSVRVDTVALARRLLKADADNCRLGTLARRFELEHQPTHRALDDAWATVDLLHLLIERSTAYGVVGLDDLIALPRQAGHQRAAKLALTATLPRSPGVYLFHGKGGEVLHAGASENIRAAARRWFEHDDQRVSTPVLRSLERISSKVVDDPVAAALVQMRLARTHRPRGNLEIKLADELCYVHLDPSEAWPRLSIVKDPRARGIHLGPLANRIMAAMVIDGLQAAVPLRRCSGRIPKRPSPVESPACEPLGERLTADPCPCTGRADPERYAALVVLVAAALTGVDAPITGRIDQQLVRLVGEQRFEDAARLRACAGAFGGAIKRQRAYARVAALGPVVEVHGVRLQVELPVPRAMAAEVLHAAKHLDDEGSPAARLALGAVAARPVAAGTVPPGTVVPGPVTTRTVA